MEAFTKCLNPQRIYNRYTHMYEYVPCTECEACNNMRSSMYTKRVMNEIKAHRFSMFFTLTYDNDHIPTFERFLDKNGTMQVRPTGRIADKYRYLPLGHRYDAGSPLRNNYEAYKLLDFSKLRFPHIERYDVLEEFGVVSKYDIQCFIKRVRRKIEKCYTLNNHDKKIRYFICSEYGPTTLRPHYHGIIFFDNEELLDKVKDIIVESWGLFERIPGARNKFVFRPYAQPAYTAKDIRLCDPNTAYYVADYVAGNTRLPEVLRLPCTRPFVLCSQGPIIGSYKNRNDEMLQAIRHGSVERIELRIDKTEQCVKYVSVPYSKGELCAMFRKCKGFRTLSSHAKSLIYSFAYDRHECWHRWAQEIAHSCCCTIKKLVCNLPFYSFRSWCFRQDSDLYLALGMDDDVTWYASVHALRMIKRYCFNGVEDYLYCFERAMTLYEQTKLKYFYENYNSWHVFHGDATMLAAYPFLVENLPYRKPSPCYNGYTRALSDVGLFDLCYNTLGYRDDDFISKHIEFNTTVFAEHAIEVHRRFTDRIKKKKQNNSIIGTSRAID